MTRLFLSFALAIIVGGAQSATNFASARPSWAAANECVLDDGNNRYRPCSGADGN